MGGGGIGQGEPGGCPTEPTAGAGSGTAGRATGRQHSGGLRRLGGDAGGVSVAGERGGGLGRGAGAALGL